MLGVFITRLGSFIVPLLFAYLTQFRHLPLTTGGHVAALFGLGSFLGTMIGGSLADRIGRRKTMLGGLVLGAGFMLVLGAAQEVWQLAVVSFLVGLSTDAFRPASQAMVADVVEPVHRMKAFSIQYWAINLGFAFSALIGGYMATRNFTALFIGDAATTLVLAFIVYRMVPESRPTQVPGATIEGSVLTPFLDPKFASFLVLNLMTALVFFQHLTGLIEDMRLKGLSTEAFGMAISANGLMIVLFQPFITQQMARLRRSTILAIAAVATGVGFWLTGFATTLPWYIATVAVWTFGEIIMSPANASIVAEVSPGNLRGRYQGAYMITWSLAAVASPELGPRVMQQAGMPMYWLACLVVGLVAALGHLTFTSRVLR